MKQQARQICVPRLHLLRRGAPPCAAAASRSPRRTHAGGGERHRRVFAADAGSADRWRHRRVAPAPQPPRSLIASTPITTSRRRNSSTRCARCCSRRPSPGRSRSRSRTWTGRRRHLHHLDHHARRLDRRPRAGPTGRARVQRLCGAACRRLSGPLRHVRGAAAARRRGEPARDRTWARRAQGRRHLPVHELSRQVARRSCVRAGHGGAQPPQGRGLHAPRSAGVLPRTDPRHQRGRDRIRHRHRARDRAAAVQRHRQPLSRHHAGSSRMAAACCRCSTSASCAPATCRRTSRRCRTA